VFALLAGLALRPLAGGGLPVRREVVWLLWLGLGGAAIHACFDYPFQVHSVVFLALLVCLVLSQISLTKDQGLRTKDH
jgi:membrane protein implicated in regulation of membrane protease activity